MLPLEFFGEYIYLKRFLTIIIKENYILNLVYYFTNLYTMAIINDINTLENPAMFWSSVAFL